MFVQLPFTAALYDFLLLHRYAHVQHRGIEKKPQARLFEKDLPEDNYILVPRKMSIMQLDEVPLRLERIEGSDVKDMLDPPNGIHFLVALPDAVVESFATFRKDSAN